MALLVPGDSLLRFSQLKISFINQNETYFIWSRCCHLTLSIHLLEPCKCQSSYITIRYSFATCHCWDSNSCQQLVDLLKDFLTNSHLAPCGLSDSKISEWKNYIRLCEIVKSWTERILAYIFPQMLQTFLVSVLESGLVGWVKCSRPEPPITWPGDSPGETMKNLKKFFIEVGNHQR